MNIEVKVNGQVVYQRTRIAPFDGLPDATNILLTVLSGLSQSPRFKELWSGLDRYPRQKEQAWNAAKTSIENLLDSLHLKPNPPNES